MIETRCVYCEVRTDFILYLKEVSVKADRVEAGSNTSIVTLRVVGEPPCS
jgi:hypothetical protein